MTPNKAMGDGAQDIPMEELARRLREQERVLRFSSNVYSADLMREAAKALSTPTPTAQGETDDTDYADDPTQSFGNLASSVEPSPALPGVTDGMVERGAQAFSDYMNRCTVHMSGRRPKASPHHMEYARLILTAALHPKAENTDSEGEKT